VFCGASEPVEAKRMWAMNVREATSWARLAKSASLYAASGCLLTRGLPSLANHPRPVPSGSRWLWADRLSGASSSALFPSAHPEQPAHA
jgi:hypothetical protein